MHSRGTCPASWHGHQVWEQTSVHGYWRWNRTFVSTSVSSTFRWLKQVMRGMQEEAGSTTLHPRPCISMASQSTASSSSTSGKLETTPLATPLSIMRLCAPGTDALLSSTRHELTELKSVSSILPPPQSEDTFCSNTKVLKTCSFASFHVFGRLFTCYHCFNFLYCFSRFLPNSFTFSIVLSTFSLISFLIFVHFMSLSLLRC